MPQFTYPIPDVYESITRPVTVAVIKQIAAITGMPEDTFIEYGGMNEGIPTYKSLIGQEAMQTGRFASFGKVQVTATETIDEDYYLSSAYFMSADAKTVMKDSDIGIMLRPFYEKVKVDLSFKYRSVDQGELRNWQTGLKRRIKMDWLDQSMQAKYNVIVPRLIMTFLAEFHRMSQQVAGDGLNLNQWLERRMLQSHTALTTMGGRWPQFALNETQVDIVGWFDFQEIPKEARTNESSTWEIEFNYRFQYERPTEFGLNYPLVIHNQLIGPKWRPDYVVYDPSALAGYAARSTSAYQTLLKNMGAQNNNARNGFIYPYFDDWWAPTPPASTTNLLQTLIAVDPNDPTLVLDLNVDNGFELDPVFRRYLEQTRTGLCTRTLSAVLLTLYCNDQAVDASVLYVDDAMQVRTTLPLDLTKMYHLQFSMMDDLFYLKPDAELTLRSNPEFGLMVLETLAPEMRERGLLPKVVEGWFIHRDDWRDAVTYLRSTSDSFKVGKRMMRPTQLSWILRIPQEK